MTGVKKFLKSHHYLIIFYGILFVSFLWPLLLFQKTFVFGDYWQQHYPWAYEYARALKAGSLPYWVPSVAGGFPLVAEGQVGAYYPLHLIFYRLLPFPVAYTLGIFLHVLIGGIGSYAYGRRIGLSKEASTLTAALFSFSSAYGGCFSNTATLRVLAWLPWSLMCMECLHGTSGKKRFLYVSLLGVIFSQMWTAGAMQMAFYAMGYLFCYGLIRNKLKDVLNFFTASALGVLLSLPQWVATLELVPLSVRSGETSAFALWGSVLPPALISLVYPKWGTFLGVSFYLGAIPILLCLVSLLSKKTANEKVHWALAALFFLLALGKYNPAYVFLVEKLSLTLLRNPSKLLFFSTVSLAVVAGFGFDRLSQLAQDGGLKRRFKIVLYALLAAVPAAPFLGQAVFKFFEGPILKFAHQSAESTFAGKKDAFHDLSFYKTKADLIYAQAVDLFSYSDAWNLIAIVFFLLAALIVLKISKDGLSSFWKRTALPMALLLDLLVFGFYIGTGFIGNARGYPEKPPEALLQTLHNRQSLEHSALIEWVKEPADEMLPASANLLYSLNHAGGYSPLLLKRYYDVSKDLGISDSSLGRRAYSEEVWKKELGLIEALGVGQILSSEKLSLPDTRLLSVIHQDRFERGRRFGSARYLYVMDRVLPFAWLAHDWKEIPREKERLSFLKSGQFRPLELAVIENSAPDFERSPVSPVRPARILSKNPVQILMETDDLSDSLLVLRSAYYSRWKAEVDGSFRPVVPVDHALSGVFLSKGKHAVRFFYDERPQKISEILAAGIFLALMLFNALTWNPKKINR